MIEIINNCIGGFIIALVVYSFFTKRAIIDFAILAIAPVYLVYLTGFKLGNGDLVSALFPFIVLIAFIGTIAWRVKNSPEEPEPRTYSREELIAAQQIYDENYVEDPEGFAPVTEANYEGAACTVDYMLGIINANTKKFRSILMNDHLSGVENAKKEYKTYESKINGEKALRTE